MIGVYAQVARTLDRTTTRVVLRFERQTAPANGVDYDIALVRYAASGSLDTTFGTGGRVTTAIGASGRPTRRCRLLVGADDRLERVHTRRPEAQEEALR
jgi:hypothetical protein